MSWTIGLGFVVGGVVIAAAIVLAWVSRERKGQQDHGTISLHWINEQRLSAQESHDR
jgi:hypothetical protein